MADLDALTLPILNISTYKFVALDELDALRDRIRALAEAADLKGTVLLANEGINMFLAGDADALRSFLDELRRDPRLADLEPKESYSDGRPFKKLLVKVKREIIRMNSPSIRPHAGRAAAVSPADLKRWLDQGHDDEGRDVVMLDTRNGFEVDHGAFRGALDWRLGKFSDFPGAVAEHRDAFEGKTVVTYCTGGIRCEKAAILMNDMGIEHVLQLDGGILKYLETQGDAHYRGECFVFDERVSVDANLAPREAAPPETVQAPALPSARQEPNPHAL